MAKVFLDENETYSVIDNSDVYGGIGSETLKIGGAPTISVQSTVERIEFEAALHTYTFKITGNVVTVNSGATTVATIVVPDTAAGQKLVFSDGSAALKITALNAATLGGVAIPTIFGAVAAELNAADSSTDASEGKLFTLTGAYTTSTHTYPPDSGVLLWEGVPVNSENIEAFFKSIAETEFFHLGVPLTDISGIADIVFEEIDGDSSATIIYNLTGGTTTIEVNTTVTLEYLAILKSMIFDADGKSRLVWVPGESSTSTTITPTALILTPTQNNGGTVEPGFTGAGNDTIVVGRPELLHGAYIDGGPGYNTLDVEMKGIFAQPLELLNIQQINVENMPNIYGADYPSGSANPGAYPPGTAGTYPYLSGIDSDVSSSALDLTTATDLELLVITEGTLGSDAGYPTPLTVAGIRNNATVRLEGAFSEDVTLQFGEGVGVVDGVYTGEVNVELRLGETDDFDLSVAQNAAVLHLDSQGYANVITEGDFGGNLQKLRITGAGALIVEENLLGFADGSRVLPVVIDASGNSGGVNLRIDEKDYVKFLGSTGSNDFTSTESSNVTITAVNSADNVFTTDYSDIVSITSGSGNDTISSKESDSVTINANNGNNTITTDNSDIVNITTGTGNDVIDSVNSQKVTISAGLGNNNITAQAREINITTNGGDDIIYVSGNDDDFSPDGALLKINTGAGQNIVNLGAMIEDGALHDLDGVTAMVGSTITGSNIKLFVVGNSDLTKATLTGITSVLMEGELTITAAQLKALGADKFIADESLAPGFAALHIIVNSNLTLSDVASLSSLSTSGVKLDFQIVNGFTLTLSAEELHKYVFEKGIDVDMTEGVVHTGKVVITNAGLTFDAFSDGTVAEDDLGGTLTDTFAESDDLTINRSVTGYQRPGNDTSTDTLTIDSTGATPLVLTSAITSIATTLNIIGNQNVDLALAPVTLGDAESDTNDFSIDFSLLTGTLTGLTVKDFSDVVSVRGNNSGTRIDVELTGDVGESGNTKGLNSSGVEQYVVTSIDTDGDGNINENESATFYLCDTTKDVTVLGLKGNVGNTITFEQVPWGGVHPTFLLEGDGYADWNDGPPKADGNPDTSNIGTLDVVFDSLQGSGAPAIVNINNGGTELGVTSTDGERWFQVDGINLTNAASLTVNVTEGDATIADINGVDNRLTTLTLTATEDVTVTAALPTTLTKIDAGDVTGIFTATLVGVAGDEAEFAFIGGDGGVKLTLDGSDQDFDAVTGTTIDGGALKADLTIKGAVTLDNATLTNINSASLSDAAALTLNFTDFFAIGNDHITVATGDEATLNLIGLDGQPFVVPDLDAGITTLNLTLANDAVITLDPTTDLTGVGSLVVPEGTELELSAAQFQQLNDGGSITGGGSVHITGLTQADVGASGVDLDLDGIDIDGTLTITLAESVDLSEADINEGGPKVDVFNVGDDITLTLGDIQDANGVAINGGATTTLQFTDQSAEDDEMIDASSFDVGTLKVLNVLVGGRNVDLMFDHLPASVVKEIYNDLGWTDMYDQQVTIAAGTTVQGDLTFNPMTDDTEIRNFTLTMSGGTEITGDLLLSTTEKVIGGTDQIHTLLDTLTINSEGTAENLLNGETDNVISGYIDPMNVGGDTVDNNLLNIEINATQNLVVEGNIIFSSVVEDDDITANDDYAATATLTVDGTNDVTIGGLDTEDDEVDALVVNHTGTGALNITLDSDLLDQVADNNDAITINGSATAADNLTIVGEVDLSDDTLSSIDSVKIENGSLLTLTQTQLDAIGAGNIHEADDNGNLNIVGLGSSVFDATLVDPDIDVVNVIIAAGNVTLDPATDLTDVDKIIVPEGSTLTLTAAQFQQLAGAGAIVGIDADGDESTDYTVNITDLKQADVDDGLDLTGITADAITLSLFEDVDLNGDTDLSDPDKLAVSIGGHTLGLENSTQADGLHVTGTAGSTLVYKFAEMDGLDEQIDAHGYDVSILKALEVFVGGTNVEDLLLNVPSSVEERYYHSPEDMGWVTATDRVVTVEKTVTVPGFLMYNDLQEGVEVRTLDLTMEGGSEIDGDLDLSTVAKDGGLITRYFDKLTIHSEGTAADKNLITDETDNVIDGDIIAVDSDAGGPIMENNLLNVEINATQNLVVDGDIVFTSVDGDDYPDAELTIAGTADVTVQQLDVTDDEVDTLAIANNGTGTLTVTGASPALNGFEGAIEEVTLSGTGDMVFGSADGATGVEAETLSVLDAHSLSGDLDLGEVVDIDSANFVFTAGTGVTTFKLTTDTLDSDLNNDGDSADEGDGAGWTFDFSTAAAGSVFEIGDPINWTAAGSILNIDLGPNTTLLISENTDWTNLDLTLIQTLDIVLADGVTLTLTAAQANGLHIVAGADTDDDPDTNGTVDIIDLGNTAVDFSGIAANISGIVTLVDDDVTLDATTDLGAFTVQLNTVSYNNENLEGQTIRFATVDQAERAITVVESPGVPFADPDAPDGANSSNVVWLFDSIASPDGVDTSGYSGNLGRLWFSETLVNNEGGLVENLFTTLPTTVLRVDFTDVNELNILLASQAVDRTMELVAFTTLSDLTFSDTGASPEEHIKTLTIDMGGQVAVQDIALDDVVAAPNTNPSTVSFDGLTINSMRALATGHFLAPAGYNNDNDGVSVQGEHAMPDNINTVGNISVGSNNGVDLTSVTLNATQADLTVGSIAFDAEDASAATLTVTTANPPDVVGDDAIDQTNVTIESLNTTDADITSLTVTHTGPGLLDVTGASPAADLGAGTETLTIAGTGDVTFGTAGTFAGVSGASLSFVNVTNTGTVDLGVIDKIDGTNEDRNDDGDTTDDGDAAFIFTNSNAANANQTTFTLGDANAATAVQAPTLAAGSTWAFDGNDKTTMTITEDVTLNYGGSLTLTDIAVKIEGDVDLAKLVDNTATLHDVEAEAAGLAMAGTTAFEVLADATLTLTAAQADGLTVTGAGTVVITGLKETPAADFSNIMTGAADTGTVNAFVDTTDDSDADALPEDVVLTGNLGIAHVDISGNGTVDATGAALMNVDRDPAGAGAEDVATSFAVGALAGLTLTAAQSDGRVVTGAGTTNVEDIGLAGYAGGANDINLASVNSSTVNIAVDTDVALNSDDNLGAAGAGRVVTIGDGITLTSVGSVVNGQYIAGENATLLVDDENDLLPATDTPITANLSHVTAEFIELVDTARVGAITFPVLYGDPIAKYIGFPDALPDPIAADDTVAVQTITLTALQASGQTINGASPDGEVIVNGLDGVDGVGPQLDLAYDLSGIDAGKMTAYVIDDDVTLHAGTDLGNFDVVLTGDDTTLTLAAGQADGLNFTEDDGVEANVSVTALEATPGADLSGIAVDTGGGDGSEEDAALDAEGGVTLSGDLGQNMRNTINVTDSNTATPDTVTFTGDMESVSTVFNLDSAGLTLVLDAADASELTVNDNAANTSVIVNNLGSGEVTFEDINADTLTVNAPADATLDPDTVIDSGTLSPYTALVGVPTDGTAFTAESSIFTVTQPMNAGQSLTINGLTVTGTHGNHTAAQVASVFRGGVVDGLTLSGASGTPAGWVAAAVVGGAGANVTFSNTVAGNVANFTASAGSAGTVNNNFSVVLAEGVDLGLTTDQLLAVGVNDFSGTAGGVSETLIVSDYNGEDIQSDELGSNVVIKELHVLGGTALVTNNVEVDADADLTLVQEIIIPQYATLTMTADQFESMPTGVITGAGTLNLTEFDSDNDMIDLSTVTALAGTITLDALAAAVVVNAAAVLDNAADAQFSFVMSDDDQSLTLSSETQADGRNVDNDGKADTILILGFTADDPTDADSVIESAGFNVANLYVLNDYLYNEFGITATPANFEFFLNNLDSGVVVTVYDTETLLDADLVDPTGISDINRTVIVQKDTAINASVAFESLHPDSEVATLDLTLNGNSVITGDLRLEQDKNPQAGLPDAVPDMFGTLTINSDLSPAGATGPNRIMGSIYADNGTDGAASESRAEAFTLTLDPAISVVGTEDSIGFDGGVVELANGDVTDDVGAALAAGTYNNWTAAYNAATNIVTFTNKNAGAVTDQTLANFTFNINGFTTTGLPGTAAVATTTQGAFSANENNLLNVEINADHALNIAGELEFRYVTNSIKDGIGVPQATEDALLTITGDADVNIGSVNTDDEHIDTLTLDLTGYTGTLTAPGTSPGLSLANTEELHIDTDDNGDGTVILGTAGDAAKPGVSGAALSLIEITGGGDVDLGVIADVDSDSFIFTSGSGVTTLIVSDTLNGPTVLPDTGWEFDLTDAAAGSELTFTDATVFTNGGDLNVDGGVNTANVNVTVLDTGADIATMAPSSLGLAYIDNIDATDDVLVLTKEQATFGVFPGVNNVNAKLQADDLITVYTNSGVLDLSSATMTKIDILDAGTATVATIFTVDQGDLARGAATPPALGSIIGNAGLNDVLIGAGTSLDLSSTTLTSIEILQAGTAGTTFYVDQADLLAGGTIAGGIGNDTVQANGTSLDLTSTTLTSIEILKAGNSSATTFTIDQADLATTGGSVIGNAGIDTILTHGGLLDLTSTTLTSIEILAAGTTVATTFIVNQADLLGTASLNGTIQGDVGFNDILRAADTRLDLTSTTLTSIEILQAGNTLATTFTVDQADLAASGSVQGNTGAEDTLATNSGALNLTSTTLTSIEILDAGTAIVATTFTVDQADLAATGTVAGNAAVNDTLVTNGGALDLTSTTLDSVEILDAGTATVATTFTVDQADLAAPGSVVGNAGVNDILATNGGALDLTSTTLTSVEILDAGGATVATTFTVDQADLASGGSVQGNAGVDDILATKGGVLNLTSTTLTSIEILAAGTTVATTFTVDQDDLAVGGSVQGDAGFNDTLAISGTSLDLSSTTLTSVEILQAGSTSATTFTVDQGDLASGGSVTGATTGGQNDILSSNGTSIDLSSTTLNNIEILQAGSTSATTFTVDQGDLSNGGTVSGATTAGQNDILAISGTSLDLSSTTLTSVEKLQVGSTSATTFTVDQGDLASGGSVTGATGQNDELIINGTSFDLSSTTLTSVEKLQAGSTTAATTFTVDQADLASGGSVTGSAGLDDILKAFGTNLDLSSTTLTSIDILQAGNANATTFTVDQADLANNGTVSGSAGVNDTLTAFGTTLDLTTTTLTSIEILRAGSTNDTTFTVTQADLSNGGSVTGNTGSDTLQLGAITLDLSSTTLTSIELVNGTAGNDTITGNLNYGITVNAGTGTDIINLNAFNLNTDTVIFDGAFAAGNASWDRLTGFEGISTGGGEDLIDIQFDLLNGATGATSDLALVAPVAVAESGTATADGVIFTFNGGAGDLLAGGTTAANAVANAVTALTSGTDFSSANIVAADSLLLEMNDGTNTFLFHYVAGGVAATTEAGDLELIGIVLGTTAQFAIGDVI